MSPRDLDKPRKRRGRKRIIWKSPYQDMPLRLRYSFSGNFNITRCRKNYVLNLSISEYALNTFQLRGRSEQLWGVGLRLVTHEEPLPPSGKWGGWQGRSMKGRDCQKQGTCGPRKTHRMGQNSGCHPCLISFLHDQLPQGEIFQEMHSTTQKRQR